MKSLKKLLARSSFIIILFNSFATASGATLIDTGQPIFGDYPSGKSLYDQQYLAGKIELTQPASITGIEAYMYDGGFGGEPGGTVTIVLYPNSSLDSWGYSIPATSVEQYSQAFSLMDVNPLSIAPEPGWQGISGLDWNLTAGSYWIAFEVRQGQTYDGYFPVADTFPFSDTILPAPLQDYAFWNLGNPGWINEKAFSNAQWGLRVFGETTASPVPLPATAWLFLSGLGILVGSIRRKITRPVA